VAESGSGRVLNGLEQHEDGLIEVDGLEVGTDRKRMQSIGREVGMVFLQFNLFPHMTVLENCTFAPIWIRKMPKAEANKLAMHFSIA